MASIFRSTLAPRAATTASLRRAASPFLMSTRSLQSGRVAFAGKETKLGSDPEARKAEIEHHKNAQLHDKEWKEEIASESESIAKADRGELKADKQSIKELQEESAKAAKEERAQVGGRKA